MYLFYLFILLILFSSSDSHANTANPTSLNLNDAIDLAVKQNSAVQIAKLNTHLAQLAQESAAYQLTPHFAVATSASSNITARAHQTFFADIGPTMTWQTPLGPTVSASLTANTPASTALSFNIAMPLIKGFGKPLVDNAVQNAKDNEKIAALALQNQVATIINTVINHYLDLMYIEALIKIDKDSIKRTQLLAHQTALLIQAGCKASNEITTVQATLASAESTLENDKNAATEIKQMLIDTIGLAPDTHIIFTTLNFDSLMLKYAFLSLQQIQTKALAHDLQYQIDAIILNGPMTRAYLTANHNQPWMLNFNMNVAKETSHIQPTDEVGLTLSIPINDTYAKNATESALIALKEARIALTAEEEEKINNALNLTHQVTATKHALLFATQATILQEKNNKMNHEKFLHGLADGLALAASENAYTLSQENLLQAKINYIKTLVITDNLMGHTLTTWQVSPIKAIPDHETL